MTGLLRAAIPLFLSMVNVLLVGLQGRGFTGTVPAWGSRA